MRRRAGLTIVEALIVFVVLCGLWWLLLPALQVGRQHRSARSKCGNALRQLGLAAIQYADDKRFFLHVRGRGELDGGMDTPDTPRKVRLLMDLGYHDNPEGWICPDSDDMFVPLSNDVKTGVAGWGWSGQTGSRVGSLDTPTSVVDPTLLETTELSYGWTRRYMTSNVRSSALLGADRSSRKDDDLPRPPGLVGNHANGSNVLQADGTVSWLRPDDPNAAHVAEVATSGLVSSPGYLTVEPPVDAPGLGDRGYSSRDAERVLWGLGPPGALFVLLASGVVLGRRGPDRKVDADASAVAKVRRSRVETLGPEERMLLGASGPTGKVVLQAAQRCPMCHDGLTAQEELTRCLACRAVFHAECVKVGGDCPTRGCPG